MAPVALGPVVRADAARLHGAQRARARRRIPDGQVATGVRAARAPWIATLDGDGQNDPADIPKLLAEREGLVIVDEVQRLPELFELLRPLCDDRERKAVFLLLAIAGQATLWMAILADTGASLAVKNLARNACHSGLPCLQSCVMRFVMFIAHPPCGRSPAASRRHRPQIALRARR